MEFLQDRQFLRLLSILFFAFLPLLCWVISTSLGHSRRFFSMISGNYLLSPERWIFAVGVFVYILCHLSLGLIANSVVLSFEYHYALSVIELIMLSLLMVIAVVPAQYVLGLHAIVGSFLFTIGVIWMGGVMVRAFEQSAPIISALRGLLSIIATSSLLGMMRSIPLDLIGELISSGNDFEKRVKLLGKDARWDKFACFEWLYFYSVAGFLLTCV
ncbi:MAG: hypothetical protein VX737_00370 [Pseudomonadota bacterium]|nr:hypothetical protein [Pseudomonadota bacterium]